MSKQIIVALLLLLPLSSIAQTTYDSLRKVYSVPNVFEKRKALDISYSKYVSSELIKFTNPEMKQLASCALVENLYGTPFLTDTELMGMVNNVLKNPASDEIISKATNLKAEILRELVGSTVKPLAFPTVTGDTIKLKDLYSSGKDYILIDMWATWCGPCVSSMKKFNALRQKYNIEFYSISLDDTIEKVQKFTAKNPAYTWPIVYGGRQAGLHAYFKITAIPAYFIVDKNGLIVSTIVGGDPERELKKLYKK